MRKYIVLGFTLLALSLVNTGCSSPLSQDPQTGGNVTVNIAGLSSSLSSSVRTVVPELPDGVKYHVAVSGTSIAVEVTSGTSVSLNLATGAWTIIATAYTGTWGSEQVELASGSAGVTVSGDETDPIPVTITLAALDEGPGTLELTISGDGFASGSKISIHDESDQVISGLLDSEASPLDFTDGVATISEAVSAQSYSLPKGRYTVDIVLVDSSGDEATYHQTVEIWSNLTTTVAFNATGKYVDPNAIEASNGGIFYGSLESALTAAEPDAATDKIVKLLIDFTVDEMLTIPAGVTLDTIADNHTITAGNLVLGAGIWKATNADVTITPNMITLDNDEEVGFGNGDGGQSAVLTGGEGSANTYTATGTGTVTLGQDDHSLTITGTVAGDALTLGGSARIFIKGGEAVTISDNAKLITGDYLDLGPGTWKATGANGVNIETNIISLGANVSFGNGDGGEAAVLIGDAAETVFTGSVAKVTLGQDGANNRSLTVTGTGSSFALGATGAIYVKAGTGLTITNAILVTGDYLDLGAGTWLATNGGAKINASKITLDAVDNAMFGKDNGDEATILRSPVDTSKIKNETVYQGLDAKVTLTQSENDLLIAGAANAKLSLWKSACIYIKAGLTITTGTIDISSDNTESSILYLPAGSSGITLANSDSKILINSGNSGNNDLPYSISDQNYADMTMKLVFNSGIMAYAVWNDGWKNGDDYNERFAYFTGAASNNTINRSTDYVTGYTAANDVRLTKVLLYKKNWY
jgi:hypothetical protein